MYVFGNHKLKYIDEVFFNLLIIKYPIIISGYKLTGKVMGPLLRKPMVSITTITS